MPASTSDAVSYQHVGLQAFKFVVLLSLVTFIHNQHMTTVFSLKTSYWLPDDTMLSACFSLDQMFTVCGFDLPNECNQNEQRTRNELPVRTNDDERRGRKWITKSCTSHIIKKYTMQQVFQRLFQCAPFMNMEISMKDHHRKKPTLHKPSKSSVYMNFGLICIKTKLKKNTFISISKLDNETDMYAYLHRNQVPAQDQPVFFFESDKPVEIFLKKNHFVFHRKSWPHVIHDFLIRWFYPEVKLDYDYECATECEKAWYQKQQSWSDSKHNKPNLSLPYTLAFHSHDAFAWTDDLQSFSAQCLRQCTLRTEQASIYQISKTKNIHIKSYIIKKEVLYQYTQLRCFSWFEYALYVCLSIGSLYGLWPTRVLIRSIERKSSCAQSKVKSIEQSKVGASTSSRTHQDLDSSGRRQSDRNVTNSLAIEELHLMTNFRRLPVQKRHERSSMSETSNATWTTSVVTHHKLSKLKTQSSRQHFVIQPARERLTLRRSSTKSICFSKRECFLRAILFVFGVCMAYKLATEQFSNQFMRVFKETSNQLLDQFSIKLCYKIEKIWLGQEFMVKKKSHKHKSNLTLYETNALDNYTFGELIANTKRLDQVLGGVVIESYLLDNFYDPAYVRQHSRTYLSQNLKCFVLRVNIGKLLPILNDDIRRFVFRKSYQITFTFLDPLHIFCIARYSEDICDGSHTFISNKVTYFEKTHQPQKCIDYESEHIYQGDTRCKSKRECINACMVNKHFQVHNQFSHILFIPETYEQDGRLHFSNLTFSRFSSAPIFEACARKFLLDCKNSRFVLSRSQHKIYQSRKTISFPLQVHMYLDNVIKVTGVFKAVFQILCLLQAFVVHDLNSLCTAFIFVRNTLQQVCCSRIVAGQAVSLKQKWKSIKVRTINQQSTRIKSNISLSTIVRNFEPNLEPCWFAAAFVAVVTLYSCLVVIFVIGLDSLQQQIRNPSLYERLPVPIQNTHFPAIFVCVPFYDETPVDPFKDDVLWEVDRLNGHRISELIQPNHSLSSVFREIRIAQTMHETLTLDRDALRSMSNPKRFPNIQFTQVYYQLRVCFGFKVTIAHSNDWRSVPHEPRRPLISFRLEQPLDLHVYLGDNIDNLLSFSAYRLVKRPTLIEVTTKLEVDRVSLATCETVRFGHNYHTAIQKIKQTFAKQHFVTNHLPIEKAEQKLTINNFDFLRDKIRFEQIYKESTKSAEVCKKSFEIKQRFPKHSPYNLTILMNEYADVWFKRPEHLLEIILIHLIAGFAFIFPFVRDQLKVST